MSGKTDEEHVQAPDGLATIHADGRPGDAEYELRRSRSVDELKKRKGLLWFGAGILVLLLAGYIGIVANADKKPAPIVGSTRDAPGLVQYEVEGSALTAALTFQTPTGTTRQTVKLPLANDEGRTGVQVSGFNPGDRLYISAQNQGKTGTVTCRISMTTPLSGQRRGGSIVVSENTATGAKATASCEGSR